MRKQVFDKYGGKCAYCGCDLVKGWHVDHLQPVRRHQTYDEDKRRFVYTGTVDHPEREDINNYMPACASCNINKHSMSLEDFRRLITGFMKHLNEVNTQYKIAKRYGLVIEDVKPIVFYFETFNNEKLLQSL